MSKVPVVAISLILALTRHLEALTIRGAWPLEIAQRIGNGNFTPAQGNGAKISATSRERVCDKDEYLPSRLESDFKGNTLMWTWTEKSLCSHLYAKDDWIQEIQGTNPPGPVFSRLCKKNRSPQILEPLAGVLRDPRFICEWGLGGNTEYFKYSIEWLVTGDSTLLEPGGRSIFFDAGGTQFMDAMQFFSSSYKSRGIIFDEIYVWEAKYQEVDAYWFGVPTEIRSFWEPRLTFYNGIPVVAEEGNEHNPVDRIYKMCRPTDFCAFKLDIDTPTVELPLVMQLLADGNMTGASLDEFFFEHHVHGLMELHGWGNAVSGSFADSIQIFSELRKFGVRAHSWI